MSKRISFTVSGKVQGVCFRDFTKQKAKTYSITGFVKNESDGTVRGEAQGKADDLERLKKDLNKGPRHAHVVRLETKDLESKDGESSFDA